MPQVYPTNKNKQNQTSNNNEVTKGTKTTIIPLLKQSESINNNHMWVGLGLGFHGLILWGWFGCITGSRQVLNAN
jgi:hypothetical protein